MPSPEQSDETELDLGASPFQLPLREAILEWCDPDLIADLYKAERRMTYSEHAPMRLALLADRSTLARPTRDPFFRSESGDYAAVREAWTQLLHDLRRRIERNDLYLEGVRLAPERQTTPEGISNTWAADMNFDVLNNTVSLGRLRFGALGVSTRIPPLHVEPPGVNAGGHLELSVIPQDAGSSLAAGVTPPFAVNADGLYKVDSDDVARLSDETILDLLEEHGRRVVGTPDAKLISPGKVSFLPIILRKMMHRAKHGELLPRLVDEGEYLAQWIASKIDHHHLPSGGTITKTLGKNYAVLKAQSDLPP